MEKAMNQINGPITYSVADACRVSSIGRTKLYELINTGRLATTKIGRRRFVSAESLRELVDPPT